MEKIHKLSLYLSSGTSALFFCVFLLFAVVSPFMVEIDFDIAQQNQTKALIEYLSIFGFGAMLFFFCAKQNLIAHFCLFGLTLFLIIKGTTNWLLFLVITIILLPAVLVFIKSGKRISFNKKTIK